MPRADTQTLVQIQISGQLGEEANRGLSYVFSYMWLDCE